MEINYAELKERAAEKSKQKRAEAMAYLKGLRETQEQRAAGLDGVMNALDKRLAEQREREQAAEIEEAERKAAEDVRQKYRRGSDQREAFRAMLADMKKNNNSDMDAVLEKLDAKVQEEKSQEERRKQQEEERKAAEEGAALQRQIELLKTGREE